MRLAVTDSTALMDNDRMYQVKLVCVEAGTAVCKCSRVLTSCASGVKARLTKESVLGDLLGKLDDHAASNAACVEEARSHWLRRHYRRRGLSTSAVRTRFRTIGRFDAVEPHPARVRRRVPAPARDRTQHKAPTAAAAPPRARTGRRAAACPRRRSRVGVADGGARSGRKRRAEARDQRQPRRGPRARGLPAVATGSLRRAAVRWLALRVIHDQLL
jgi:hypothetical protein